MRRLVELFRTGITALTVYPARSTASFLTLQVMLVPFLIGSGISEGLEREEAAAIRAGGDLYVQATRFGSPVPLPVSFSEELRILDGVTGVVPRVTGQIQLGRDSVDVVILGLPITAFRDPIQLDSGRFPQNGGPIELVVGSELAQRLKLTPGSPLPPFYHNPAGEKVSLVVGQFDSKMPFWQSHVMLTTIESAQHVFAQEGWVTEFVVQCRSGYTNSVRNEILRSIGFSSDSGPSSRLQVTPRSRLAGRVSSRHFRQLGVFTLHFVLLFAAGLLVILVTSGYGQAERRREVGILKATGWQTDDVLLRTLAEGLTISTLAAAVSVVVAVTWLRFLNGAGIAGIFIAEIGAFPTVSVPFQLMPQPAIIGLIVSVCVTLSGSLYSAWKSAIASPDEAMR